MTKTTIERKSSLDRDLRSRYEELLRGTHAMPEEAARQTAYEFGRELCAAGLGVLDLAAIHQRVVAQLLVEGLLEPAAFVEHATELFLESLMPFEMINRGFLDANAALRASEERYRDLFENANDIIFTTDLHGNFTSVNRAGELLSGFTREQVQALNIESIVAPEEARRLMAQLRGLRAGRGRDERTRHELEIIARDGRRVPLEVNARVIHDDHGRASGLQGIARDITDRRQAESALRYLNQRLEEKAQRIAHALHDEAGQLLASVYLSVAEIAGDLPRDGRRRLDELRALLDQVDDQIRRLAHELRPTILDDLGLLPACQFLAEGVSKRAGFKVTVHGSTGGRLPPDVETALYRVVQETLTNVTRHARARQVTVEFVRTLNGLSGCIQDDGVGFDLPTVLSRTHTKGLGLMGMRERLVAVSGTLSIDANPGLGTAIRFEVPLEG
jgi:PAS domain S-box-containing protein